MSIKEEIEEKKIRLAAYKQRELKMLNDGVQSYGIGSRSVTRYNTDLSNIQKMIKSLEDEIKSLENQLNGRNGIITMKFVPGDR